MQELDEDDAVDAAKYAYGLTNTDVGHVTSQDVRDAMERLKRAAGFWTSEEIWINRDYVTKDLPDYIKGHIVLGDGFIDLLVAKPLSWWNCASPPMTYTEKALPAGRYKVIKMDEHRFYCRLERTNE